MERKTIETLRTMICGEIDEIAKKGILTHETLDILKDLVETEKNLGKIEKYDQEKGEFGYEMGMDKGYSQRKYYIDADYNPYDMNSYGRGRMMYNMDGNSYTLPMRNNSYSHHSSKQEMIEEIEQLMAETTDEKVKKALQETIEELNK